MSPDTGRQRATATTTGATLSTSQFKRELSGLLSAVAEEHGLNWRSPTTRGRAFEYWVAQLISDFESGFDGELSEVVMGSKDLGADLVLEDVGNRLLLIMQCKYRRLQDEVAEADVNDFFNRHAHYQDRTWVMAHGSDAAASALCDYGERIRDGWKVEYRFITTARASERVRELARRCDERYRAGGEPLRCVLYDFSALKEYYLRSRSIAQAIPERVELDLPESQWFEKSGLFKTMVAVIKGNTLRNLALQHRHTLYAVNIRGYLGNRGINNEIAQTAVSQPANFFYFNNRVSAICTRFEITGNHLVATHFQVINGAQTVSSLAHQEPRAGIDVLFRLTETPSISTESGFNHDIVQYNNTQNAIKTADFRANDPIQLFLFQHLSADRAHGSLPVFHYIPKRSVGRKDSGIGIGLEELAKIRYSYLYDPATVHRAAKSLWTLAEDEGYYERAFGVAGHLQEVWSQEDLAETCYAIALNLRITRQAKMLGDKDKNLKFMFRLRFHVLALAGIYACHNNITGERLGDLLDSKEAFEAQFTRFWSMALPLLIYRVQEVIDNGTLFDFLRSQERWVQLRKTFSMNLVTVS